MPPKPGADYGLTKTLVVQREGQETAREFATRIFSKFVGARDAHGRAVHQYIMKVDGSDGDYVDGDVPLINFLAVREPFASGDRARLSMVPRDVAAQQSSSSTRGGGGGGGGPSSSLAAAKKEGENSVQARVRLVRKQAEQAREERIRRKYTSSGSSGLPGAGGGVGGGASPSGGPQGTIEWTGPFPRNPEEIALYKKFMKKKYEHEERMRKEAELSSTPSPKQSPRIQLTVRPAASKEGPPKKGRRGTLTRLKKGKGGWQASMSPKQKRNKGGRTPLMGGVRDSGVKKSHLYPSAPPSPSSDGPAAATTTRGHVAEAASLLALARDAAAKVDAPAGSPLAALLSSIEAAHALANQALSQ